MTPDPSTEALLLADELRDEISFVRRPQAERPYSAEEILRALAARLSQAEEERKKAQGGWDACAELLEAAGSDYQRAAARLSQAEERLAKIQEEAADLAMQRAAMRRALKKIESLPRRLHPIAGYMFDTDPCRIAERALAASSAGETPDG